MRIKTQEERELEQIVHKANKEGWVKPVCVKSGRLKGLVLHGKLKEDHLNITVRHGIDYQRYEWASGFKTPQQEVPICNSV